MEERLEKLTVYVNDELEVGKMGQQIQNQVQKGIDKNQREYYLREQLKAIQKELGVSEQEPSEIHELKEKLEKKNLPEAAHKVASKEIEKLSKMNPSSSEYTVTTNYLDWLLTLPWSESTVDKLDIKKAERILNKHHYDLQKVKKRILEYLAVRKLNPNHKGPILCLVGPPGTGKTSLGRSIAEAIGRKFVRISLGGVRDEAEIRGHRRTYVGALPGRIIHGLRKAGSNNPIFMLDEVDKIGNDFRGDPASALLEVLDPEQNFSFSDHYLEVEFDLSKVMFITTANQLDTIPRPLLDRMEVLELPGYTEEEKVEIAKKFLIPRQIKEHGLDPEKIHITRSAIKKIIREYTREAGVRNVEREIGGICRSLARRIAEGKTGNCLGESQEASRTHWTAEILFGHPREDRGARCCHGHGMDSCRRGHPVRRGHDDARSEVSGSHRAAGGCDEGIRPGSAQLREVQSEESGNRGGFLQRPRSPHPCACRGHPQRRAVGRGDHPDGSGIASDLPAHQIRCGHDR